MNRNSIRVMFTTILLSLVSSADPDQLVHAQLFGPTKLRPEKPLRTTMDLLQHPTRTFRLEIPKDARLMRIKVTKSPVIFDIFGNYADSQNEYDHLASESGDENEMWVTREDEVPLEAGDYEVTLDYSAYVLPRLRNKTIRNISYTIAVEYFVTRVDAELSAKKPLRGKLGIETGFFQSYVVDVPHDAKVLRVELSDIESDLDVLLRHGKPILDTYDADHLAASTLSREILIVDQKSDPPLRPGRYYIDVVDPWMLDEAHFTLHTTFDREPRKELLALPKVPLPDDLPTQAIHSSVEIFAGTTGASGTIVTPAGLMLTNYHVVSEAVDLRPEKATDFALDELVISVTLDPSKPPENLFRGKVLDTVPDEDLALVQITQGYYGQKLPDDYRFPFMKLGDPKALKFGDQLRVVGFPGIGGFQNRPTVTLTRGIVSGFSKPAGANMRIKTDALITAGNSGGAAFNDQWQLIGIPSMVVGDVSLGLTDMGIVFSVEALPKTWREKIAAGLKDAN